MVTIGFVCHSQRPEAERLLRQTGRWLEERGHQVRLLDPEGAPPWSAGGAAALDGVSLAVSLGGDGTMLRAVDLVNDAGIPVLGVNLGHLGYLTAVEPDELCPTLERFLGGDYAVEARMTLDLEVGGAGDGHRRHTALNDLVLTRPQGVHTV